MFLIRYAFFQKKSIPCITWLIGVAVVEVGRLVAAIYFFRVSFMSYALFYWILRIYQFWCVWLFTNSVRRLELRKVKRKKKKRKDQLVPVTYYGFVKKRALRDAESDTDDITVREIGDADSTKTCQVEYVRKNKN
jgi:hypothetical protein